MPGYLKTHSRWRPKLADVSWDAAAAWHALRMYCLDVGNDGYLPKSKVHVALDRKVSEKRAEAIVLELAAEGLVESVTLEQDGKPSVSCWMACDWVKDQLKTIEWEDPVAHDRMLRNKQLGRNKDLCQKIKDRDRSLCRYCGIRVDWLDKKGAAGATYDHVDPDGDNSLSNVVVACRKCNGIKRDRTPEQAGMSQLKAGTTAASLAAASAATPVSDPTGGSARRSGPARSGPSPDLTRPRERSRDRTGPDPDLAGSDRARSNPPGPDLHGPSHVEATHRRAGAAASSSPGGN